MDILRDLTNLLDQKFNNNEKIMIHLVHGNETVSTFDGVINDYFINGSDIEVVFNDSFVYMTNIIKFEFFRELGLFRIFTKNSLIFEVYG